MSGFIFILCIVMLVLILLIFNRLGGIKKDIKRIKGDIDILLSEDDEEEEEAIERIKSIIDYHENEEGNDE